MDCGVLGFCSNVRNYLVGENKVRVVGETLDCRYHMHVYIPMYVHSELIP